MPLIKTIRQFYICNAISICSILNLSAQASLTPEYELKAVFLYNFTQFVDWPSGSFTSAESPIVIGVIGENPFGTYLEETVAGEKANGHPVIVRYYHVADEITDCQIVFLNLPEGKKRRHSRTGLNRQLTSSITHTPAFLKYAGMPRFFTTNNKMQLEVNREAVKTAGRVMSWKGLRLVQIFQAKKNN